MKKKVVWEKWVDPLNSNLSDVEWPGFDDGGYEDEEESEVHTLNTGKVLHTPFGMLSVYSNTMASNCFDFWWMHTNFDITNDIKNTVKVVPGVETLEVYTRYRMRVGFSKSGLFDNRKVMNDIKKSILEYFRSKQNFVLNGLPLEVAHKIIDIRNNIDNKYDKWAIFMLPNGNVETVVTNETDDDIFNYKLDILNFTYQLIGGRILTSDMQ